MKKTSLQRTTASQRGFFLIEAMVAILIFALGILGLVAMGGTAVSSQSDAQYRTDASSLADAIAGEIAVGINRTDAATKALSLAAFAYQPAGANCVFTASPTPPSLAALLGRAANMPGATTANQQITIDNSVNAFNRVEITLCWRTANDNVWRRHTLVTYVN